MNEISQLYSQSQRGGELPYFVGKQYGGGWLSAIGRFAFPILRRLGFMAAKAVQPAGKMLFKKGKEIVAEALPKVAGHILGKRLGDKLTNPTTTKPRINKRRKYHKTIFSK